MSSIGSFGDPGDPTTAALPALVTAGSPSVDLAARSVHVRSVGVDPDPSVIRL